ncbi:hypothetical protein [Kitasatospora cathayae]|uniref:Uncharacterized protein n=1 Tax=Kitasatospora cathayae TaxID=3004092 RepID=A0ABY7QJX9_9ACTN|nr:hypothetical protein [Kitasatospora sp. HUAS 3-15]WBP92181.1 hypothetical protein O1G21_41280 [Kitasatospora sp. HUAS 3-15]
MSTTPIVPGQREDDVPDGAFRVAQAAPVPAVTVFRYMVFGSGLTEPHDMTGLLHLLFLTAKGDFTMADLLASLRSEGISSANGKGLIGDHAVKDMVRRFIQAGFVRKLPRTRKPGKKGFGPQEYEVYLEPAYNPDWQGSVVDVTVAAEVTKPQVVVPGLTSPVQSDLLASNGKTAGRSTGPDKPRTSRTGPDKPRTSEDKTAGRSTGPDKPRTSVSPPHPPEGGYTLPPTPTGTTGVGSGEEGEDRYATKLVTSPLVAAAADFLQDLPRPWTVGRDSAHKLAPLLADVVVAQGWELDEELVAELTANPGGIQRYASVLPKRIKDLPRRQPRFATQHQATVSQLPIRTTDGPLSPCRLHPDTDAARCAPCNEREAERDAQRRARAATQRQASQPQAAGGDVLSIIERARRNAASGPANS